MIRFVILLLNKYRGKDENPKVITQKKISDVDMRRKSRVIREKTVAHSDAVFLRCT